MPLGHTEDDSMDFGEIFWHHQAIIYGNHVKELQELGEIVGFEVEVFR